MFEHDSWSQWNPDPERAFREHDPTLEPYASMTRDEILATMREARGGQQWEFLREFLLDKCSEAELDYDHFLKLLIEQGGLSSEELSYVGEQACMATRLLHAAPSSTMARVDVALDARSDPPAPPQPPPPYQCCG
jgi:hypothetical protein